MQEESVPDPSVEGQPHNDEVNLDAKNKDKKKSFIVEEETVNTEATNILPPPNTSTSEVNSVLTPIMSEGEVSENNNNNNNNNNKNKNNLTSNDIDEQKPVIQQVDDEPNDIHITENKPVEVPVVTLIPKGDDNVNINESTALSRPPIINASSKESSSNSLIDNNPLPIPSHATNILLKNKKSSLLVDSQDLLNQINPDNNDNPEIDLEINNNNLDAVVDEVIKDQRTPMSLRANPMENIDLENHEKNIFSMNRTNSMENKDRLNVKNKSKAIDPRLVSKIIERPVIPSMNSRDLLLNENKPLDDSKEPIIENNEPKEFEIKKAEDNKKIIKTPHEEVVPISKDNDTPNELETQEDDTNGQKANKTDFFAARLATAVGENEISDSEETFVYESAANSTKNLIYPNTSSTNQINDLWTTPHSTEINENSMTNKNNHGIATKMSVPLLNTNKKLMNRLKNTRHTSTGGILAHSSIHGSSTHFPQSVKSHIPTGNNNNNNNNNNNAIVNTTSNLNTDINPSNLLSSYNANTTESSISNRDNNINPSNNNNLYSLNNNHNTTNNYGQLHGDDIPSIRSINNNTDRQNDIQSVRSFLEEQHLNRSPEKRMSTLSLNKIPPGVNVPIGSVQKQTLMKIGSANPSMNQSCNNNNNINNNSNNNNSNNNNAANIVGCKKNSENKRVLRTTVSKIFDNNGTPLRGYSGVPDNVNLEDYIEQTDDLESMKYESGLNHPNNINNSNNLGPRLSNNDGYSDAFNDPKRLSSDNHGMGNNWNMSPGTYYVHDTSAIKEEDEDDSINNNNKNNNTNSNSSKSNIPKQNSVIKNNNMGADQDNHFARGNDNNNGHPHNEDDVHSTFYYNHRADLEARPQISDYEDDDIDPDADDGLYADSGYYRSHSNGDTSHVPYYGKVNGQGISNGNTNNRSGGYYDYQYVNEYTPLRHSTRKRLSRNQLNFSPHDFTPKRSFFTRFKNGLYYIVLVLILLATGFSFGFILATNKELQDFDILLLDNVISSAEELIFDITASAFNPGFITITMDTIDIDVFAKSEPVLDTEALFLGTIEEMETPLTFAGGFFNRRYAASTTALKIISPGNSTLSDNMKWRKLIKYDYELVLRGTMKYSIPFFDSVRSVNVQKSAVISGRKGEHDEDSDLSLILPIDLL